MPTVHIDDTDIHYEESGDGPTLLLIHGSGGGGIAWEDMVERLAPEFRVIAYDRRGFGRSAGPPASDFHRDGRDAAGLLRALDASPAAVLGWSGGGIVALDLAIFDPELVRTLVFAEPPLYLMSNPLTPATGAVFGTVQELAGSGRVTEAGEHFFRWASSRTTGGNAYDDMAPAVQVAMRDSAPAVMADLQGGTGEYLTPEMIGAIACPVTCLLGELTHPDIVGGTDRLMRLLPQAELVPIPGAGHALHFDQPDTFETAVRAACRARTESNR